MQYVILIGILAALVLLVLLLLQCRKNGASAGQTDQLQRLLEQRLRTAQQEQLAQMQAALSSMGDMLARHQQQVGESQTQLLTQTQQGMMQQLQQFEQRLQSLEQNLGQRQEQLRSSVRMQLSEMQEGQNTRARAAQEQLQRNVQQLSQQLQTELEKTGQFQQQTLQEMVQSMRTQLQQFETRLKTLESTHAQGMGQIQQTVSQQLQAMQTQQKTSLDEIRGTVDEKLSKTLEDNLSRSFQRVSKQLEDVYKGLGEMQSLASGVGDLKKVLSNVKTRGILGEIQLGAILQEILSPEQYETEIPTIPGSREHVEFAIRLPGDGERCVYLPIDSKFPGDTFAALQDAYETGSRERIDAAKKQLEQVIRGCAKDIHDKYIEPPYTTNFAILFLPFEGLYAEVVNSAGLVERLQREYHINVAGPSTMAAILNALQMGFQTLAIQKRSDEVWRILGAVKTEFDKFSEVLQKAQKSLQGAEKHLDTLIGTRSNAIQRKLRDVERLEETQATRLLGLPVGADEES